MILLLQTILYSIFRELDNLHSKSEYPIKTGYLL